MDSDSNSDGFHISVTPPRDLKPSSPPQPPPLFPGDPFSPPINPEPPTHPPAQNSFHNPNADLPNLMRSPNSTIQHHPMTHFPFSSQLYLSKSEVDRPIRIARSVHSLETLPAGFFSKSVSSFSKFRGASLNFEPVEDDPFPSSPLLPQPKVEIGGRSDCLAADRLPEEFRDEEVVCSRYSQKVSKKHSNLIGGNAPMPDAKLWKCGGEGDFVRLNLNRKRKFMNKGRRGNSNYTGGRRFYIRKKKNLRAEGGEETANVFEEDGLVVDIFGC